MQIALPFTINKLRLKERPVWLLTQGNIQSHMERQIMPWDTASVLWMPSL